MKTLLSLGPVWLFKWNYKNILNVSYHIMAKNFACSIHFLNFVDNHTSLSKIKHILIHYTIWYTQRILNCVEQLFLPWVASIMLLLWQQSTLLHSCIPWKRQTTVEWVPACGTNARNFLSTGNTCPVNFNKENHVNMSQKAICMTIISTNFPWFILSSGRYNLMGMERKIWPEKFESLPHWHHFVHFYDL